MTFVNSIMRFLTLGTGTALVAAAFLGCSDTPEETGEPPIAGCTLEPLGDLTKPIEMELVYLDAEKKMHPLANGDAIPMIVPPQGGWVIFVGARATNIDPCGVTVKGVLRDANNQQVRLDQRTTKLVSKGDGWGSPVEGDISTVANVPTCPNQWASQAIPNVPIELTYSLKDRGGRTASKTIQVVPECAEPIYKNACLCQCSKDYVLGESCLPK